MSENDKATVSSYITNIGNELGYSLRKSLYHYLYRHLPNEYREKPENKHALRNQGMSFQELPWLKEPYRLTSALQEQERQYLSEYPIASLYERCTCLRWLESLTILDYLNFFRHHRPFLPEQASKRVHWLDVGSKNWAYVDALWAFLATHTPDHPLKTLEGIEIDPYRRYTDGFHRIDYAQHYVNRLPNVPAIQTGYHACDIQQWPGVRNTTGKYQVITWFLPFVFEEPLRSWGLPVRHFEPERTLYHVLELLDDEGYLLLVNQTDDEYKEQQKLLNGIRNIDGKGETLEILTLGELPASFLPFRYTRYATLCRKAAST